MKMSFFKFIQQIVLILLVVILGYFFRNELVTFTQITKEYFFPTPPCSKPISYSIGSIDPNFNISKNEFIDIITKAEQIWEIHSDKNLLEYSENGSIKINLIYDYRQKVTDDLSEINVYIKNDKTEYESIKIEYQTLVEKYNNEKLDLQRLITSYDSNKVNYEKEVNYWNRHGGAPKEEFSALEKKRISLNNEVNSINEAQASLNILVNKINSTVADLNNYAKNLNLKVKEYNTIGASTGDEFSEGEYIYDTKSKTINIYQYENKDSLTRVLAHEFGHALTLEHVDDPQAIMYRRNESKNGQLTDADISALKEVCSES